MHNPNGHKLHHTYAEFLGKRNTQYKTRGTTVQMDGLESKRSGQLS